MPASLLVFGMVFWLLIASLDLADGLHQLHRGHDAEAVFDFLIFGLVVLVAGGTLVARAKRPRNSAG